MDGLCVFFESPPIIPKHVASHKKGRWPVRVLILFYYFRFDWGSLLFYFLWEYGHCS